MTTWTDDELARIGAADELDIAPRRADGTASRPTTIWVVQVGNDLFVRSWHGRTDGWYLRVRATQEGQIRAAGVERDVAFAEPDPGVRDAVDQAYRAKYARYGETYVVPMVSDDAAAATLQPFRTDPASASRPGVGR